MNLSGLFSKVELVPAYVHAQRREAGPHRTMPPRRCAKSDAELIKLAGNIANTIFDPASTATGGAVPSPMAVVDSRLRAIGVEGLRVAEASVMPTTVNGNTNSPKLMIAEKAAHMILENARSSIA